MDGNESSVRANLSIGVQLAQHVNDQILEIAEAWQTEESEFSFLCECGSADCRDRVRVSAAKFRRLRSNGPVVVKHTTIRTVGFEGELDLYNLDLVEETLTTALEGASRVVVDLSRVTFIDSNILGTFVTTSARADAVGIALTFAVPADGPVRRALMIARLDRVIAIRDGALADAPPLLCE